MSFISGLIGGGGGGLAALAKNIPIVGEAASALAPLAGMAASLIPGGAIVTAALDVAGGIAGKAIDAKKEGAASGASSAITF